MNERVIVLGAQGQLGGALQKTRPAAIKACWAGRRECDIRNDSDVRALLRDVRPSWVINTAAYTQVDAAEQAPDDADEINHVAVGRLAAACRESGARLMHVSTDFVFNGRSGKPYASAAATDPLNVYGRSKRAGEIAALGATDGSAVIVRTAWLFSATGANFLTTIAKLLLERSLVRVVDDQHGTPTSANDLATTLWSLLQHGAAGGVYHFTNAGQTTWFGFAKLIRSTLETSIADHRLAVLEPITTAEFPRPAVRPSHSTLECSSTYGIVGVPAAWEQAVHDSTQAWMASLPGVSSGAIP